MAVNPTARGSRPPAEAGPDANGRRARRRRLLVLLRAAVGIALLVWIIATKAPLAEIGRVLSAVDLRWLALSLTLQAVGLLMSTYRWQILAHALGDAHPLGFLVKSYLIGAFFNQFLPTSFGGDVYRVWDVSRRSRSVISSGAIVAVERVTGIVVLFIFALVASVFRLEMASRIQLVWLALALGAVSLAGLALFLSPVAERFAPRRPPAGLVRKAVAKIFEFRAVVLEYRKCPGPFLKATIWALVLQVNVIFYFYLIGRALGLGIGFLDYFIFIPIVLLVQILPITINGLGLREAAYVAIFSFYGIGAGAAVSYSLLDAASRLLLGIAGGLLYVSRR